MHFIKITVKDVDQIIGIVCWPLKQIKLASNCLILVSIIAVLSIHCINKNEDKDEISKKLHIELCNEFQTIKKT